MKALIVMTASNCINTDKQFHKKSIICCKNLLLVLFPKTEKEITLEKKKRRKRQTKVKVHNPREEKNNHPDTIPHSHMNTPSLLQSCKYLHESLTVLNKLWCYLSLFIMDYQLALGSTTSLSYGYYSLFYYFIYLSYINIISEFMNLKSSNQNLLFSVNVICISNLFYYIYIYFLIWYICIILILDLVWIWFWNK